MHRHGKTSSGNEHWKCVPCYTTSVNIRPDVRVRHLRHRFLQWVTSTRSLTERASDLQLSRQQLGKLFNAFWTDLPASPAQVKSAEVLILDGVYLSGRTNVVLIARDLSNVHAWSFADRECFAAWNAFLSHLSPPTAVVIDEEKGLQQAILQRFPKNTSSDVLCMLNALSGFACQGILSPKQANSSDILCARSGMSGLKKTLNHGFSSLLHGRGVMRNFWLNAAGQLKRAGDGIPIEN